MLIKKPPIVVILGHIDHGKTTLLDCIRKSNISVTEAGGITQRIGAYEIDFKGEKMTFIDTPGHAAFDSLRKRGVNIADLAVLVIAADEGIKPQTQESINYLKSAKIPFVIALNKIDKKEADSSRVISQLVELDVLPEKFGGEIPLIEISALKGIGIEELLEILILIRDLNDLKVENEGFGEGYILETFKDAKRGILASGIVVKGKIKSGEYIITSDSFCKIKIFEDDRGKRIEIAEPSKPFLVGNFDKMPSVGDVFMVGDPLTLNEVRKRIELVSKTSLMDIFSPLDSQEKDALGLIIKADSVGSLEALAKIFGQIIKESAPKFKFIRVDIGSLTVDDIYLAKELKAILINFNLRIPKNIIEMIKDFNLRVFDANVIYQLEKDILEYLRMKKADENYLGGQLEVLAVFSETKSKKTIGGQVKEGMLKVGQKLFLQRDNQIIAQLKILSIEKNKVSSDEVKEGDICGLVVECPESVQVGDYLISNH
ncbi:MAG: GTP-binding protein [Patescibacteria group bacterium]|nr:GTP-binding protein [Patescibacteria group bacterium]